MAETETAGEPIALIDLKAQQARIRDRLDSAIGRVLDHGRFIMGPEVAELERRLAAHCGAKHVITCSSGTDALLMALMAKGIGAGDAVICPAFTYTATPEVIAILGAKVVFCDVDPDTFNIDAKGLGAAIETAKEHGLRPRAVMPVDLFGLPADYEQILPIARQHELFVLCDAAQSLGAEVGGRTIGSIGDATATSFFPSKPLACYGDGGAVFTDDDWLAERLRSIRLHGKEGDKYNIVRVGINGRLDTLQAAILLEKLEIFRDELARRKVVAERYTAGLTGVVQVPRPRQDTSPAWAHYTIVVPDGGRDRLAQGLQREGMSTAVYYPRPVHQQKAYRQYPVSKGGVAVAERLCRSVLSLPMHPYLGTAEQDRVIAATKRLLSG